MDDVSLTKLANMVAERLSWHRNVGYNGQWFAPTKSHIPACARDALREEARTIRDTPGQPCNLRTYGHLLASRLRDISMTIQRPRVVFGTIQDLSWVAGEVYAALKEVEAAMDGAASRWTLEKPPPHSLEQERDI